MLTNSMITWNDVKLYISDGVVGATVDDITFVEGVGDMAAGVEVTGVEVEVLPAKIEMSVLCAT